MLYNLAALTVPPEALSERFSSAPVRFRTNSDPMHALPVDEAQGNKGRIPTLLQFSRESLGVGFTGKTANLHGPARHRWRLLVGWNRLFCQSLF